MRKLLVLAAATLCFAHSEIVNLSSKKPTQNTLKPSRPLAVKATSNNKKLTPQRLNSTSNVHPSYENSFNQEIETPEAELFS